MKKVVRLALKSVVFITKRYSAETKEEFMNGYLDKKQCFEPDPSLMEQLLNMFDEYCTSN